MTEKQQPRGRRPEQPQYAAEVIASYVVDEVHDMHADTEDEATEKVRQLRRAVYWLRKWGGHPDLRCRPGVEPDPAGGFTVKYWAHPPFEIPQAIMDQVVADLDTKLQQEAQAMLSEEDYAEYQKIDTEKKYIVASLARADGGGAQAWRTALDVVLNRPLGA